MTAPDPPAVRRRWTLRTRMVLAIAALAALGLVAANVAGVLLIRSYLVHQVDDQLRQAAAPFHNPMNGGPDGGGGPGGGGPPRAPDRELRGIYNDFNAFFYDSGGTLQRVIGQETAPYPDVGTYAEVTAHAGGGQPYSATASDGAGWRALAVSRTAVGGTTSTVVVALSLAQVDGTVDQLIAIDAVVTLVVLVLLALAGSSLVRVGLRPLNRMEGTAEAIAAGDLSRRVPDEDPHTEVGRLGRALNAMLGQIESALRGREASEARLRRFVADASHELRTPLTSIRGFAELYRRGGARSGPELDRTMARIEGEAGRMGLLVDDLLLLARLDEERPSRRDRVDLLEVAADAVRDAHARAPDRTIRLTGPDGDRPEPVRVEGDEPRLRQVVNNLLANAIMHTGGDVTVRVGPRPAGPTPEATAGVGVAPPPDAPAALLEVADTGPGIPAEQAGLIFERLYRAETSRSRAYGGSGLGLSIVAAIVTGHDGRAEVRTAPGQGAVFRVVLPAEDAAIVPPPPD